MSKKVLVTGGSGFLGSSLVKKCLAEGWDVRVLDDNSRGRDRRLADVTNDIDFVVGDIRNYDTVKKACQGMDAIAHLAFVNGTEFFYSKPKLVLEVGVKGALNTLDAAIELGIKDYWMMSSSEVYQTPPTVPTDETVGMFIPDPLNARYSYGGGKLISELLAFNYARGNFDRVVVVRPHNVYGGDMGYEHVLPQFILRAHDLCSKSDGEVIDFPIKGDGTQTRSFVYIDDFTDGCYRAFAHGDTMNIYHVGTMDEVTIKQVAEKVVESFGRKANVVPSEAPLGETNRRCPDTAKVSGLGYSPKVSLDEGIARTREWYVANPEPC